MPRCENFIEYACGKIREYDLRQCNLYVVLPTLRLERTLSTRLQEKAREADELPCFLPRFTTMDRLISEFSLLRKGDTTELIAHLYAAYREAYTAATDFKSAATTEVKTPDQFYDWASMLISDFNDIDNQLAPAKDMLQYMAEEKRIGAWSLELGGHTGELQSRYLQFYQKLWPIYRNFTARLQEAGCAYTGLAGRTAAQRLPLLVKEGALPQNDFYLFVGFNALTLAEKSIIKTLVRARKAETVWNADAYYMDEDSPQEAGYFLRQYRQDPDLNHYLKDEDFSDTLRRVPYRMIGCPQNTGQAKTAAALLADKLDPAGTLVVLNDETLLAPLMNALPENLPCNVSIAGGLSGTCAGALFHTLLEAREQVRQSGSRNLQGNYLIRLLQNPFFAASVKGAQKIIATLLEEHQNYFSRTDFQNLLKGEELDLYTEFIYDSDTPRFFSLAEQIGYRLSVQAAFHNADSVETRYLRLLQEACAEQDLILKNFPDIHFGPQSLKKIFEQCLQQIGIHYLGDAAHSVNITGMLETRGMCFDHVIILSMNEGILPGNKQDESFLLHSLKQYYGLPTEKERTAMAAHHFYSLLQNSRSATLLYTASGSDASREPSRFLLQLQHELPQNNQSRPNSTYPFPLFHPAYTLAPTRPIEKTPALLQELKDWLTQKRVSYSALSQYLACPMHFYYQRILGIEEPPEIEEEMEPGTKGSVFHCAMENFFSGKGPDKKSRLNRILTLEDVEDLQRQKYDLVADAMKQEFKKGTYLHGVNHVAHQEILFWMDRYAALLKKEVENGSLTVQSCEKKFLYVLPDAVDGKGVTMIGFADRIDLFDDGSSKGPALRIVDYKTGEIKNLVLEGECLADNRELLETPDGKQAFQLLLYLYLYDREFKQLHPGAEIPYPRVEAHICSVRGKAEMRPLTGEFLGASAAEERTQAGRPALHRGLDAVAAQTEVFIREVIAKILDPSEPIVCTPNEDSCKYCPYSAFCASPEQTSDEEN